MVRKAKEKEVALAIADMKKDTENYEPGSEDLFKESDQYNPVKIDDFSVADKGVTFYHDYGFPHIALALQPAGEFVFTWKQLRPFIRSGGLLAGLAR